MLVCAAICKNIEQYMILIKFHSNIYILIRYFWESIFFHFLVGALRFLSEMVFFYNYCFKEKGNSLLLQNNWICEVLKTNKFAISYYWSSYPPYISTFIKFFPQNFLNFTFTGSKGLLSRVRSRGETTPCLTLSLEWVTLCCSMYEVKIADPCVICRWECVFNLTD